MEPPCCCSEHQAPCLPDAVEECRSAKALLLGDEGINELVPTRDRSAESQRLLFRSMADFPGDGWSAWMLRRPHASLEIVGFEEKMGVRGTANVFKSLHSKEGLRAFITFQDITAEVVGCGSRCRCRGRPGPLTPSLQHRRRMRAPQ